MAEIAQEKGVEPAAIEVWFADEARIGQKNKITRRWARRGTRPAAPTDQRTASAYIFGAICPALGKGAALVLPRCNTAAMNLQLAEIAQAIAPRAQAVLLVDQAGWHLSHRLVIPPNITLVPLPPKCPEPNPVENIGSSCETTGCRTASSRPTRTFSTTAAMLGTSSSPSRGRSCPSVSEIGHMGSDQRALVLGRDRARRNVRARESRSQT